MTQEEPEPQGASLFLGLAIGLALVGLEMVLVKNGVVPDSNPLVWLFGAIAALLVSYFYYREERAELRGVDE